MPRSRPSWRLATLDELRNDITRETVASFEPAIDYVVLLRFRASPSRNSPAQKDELTTSMKSVGEAMSIGRTFKEAPAKGLRSMEIGAPGLGDNLPCPPAFPRRYPGKLARAQFPPDFRNARRPACRHERGRNLQGPRALTPGLSASLTTL